MTREEYNKIIEKQIEECRAMMIRKAEEYAADDNPHHNFDAGEGIYGGNSKKVLGGYMLKHVISIYDMINSDKPYPLDKWQEKITDNINYLLILRTMVERELPTHTKSKNALIDDPTKKMDYASLIGKELY